MNYLIDAKGAAEVVAELSKGLRGTHTLRIETDTLKKCESKIVRTPKHLIGQEQHIVHLLDDQGTLEIKPLKSKD